MLRLMVTNYFPLSNFGFNDVPSYLTESRNNMRNSRNPNFFVFSSLFLLFLQNVKYASSIACFKCVSAGGDNPNCEDPFHNNMTMGEVTLEQPCMGGRKGRDGLFPASDCIKVTGYYADTGE